MKLKVHRAKDRSWYPWETCYGTLDLEEFEFGGRETIEPTLQLYPWLNWDAENYYFWTDSDFVMDIVLNWKMPIILQADVCPRTGLPIAVIWDDYLD